MSERKQLVARTVLSVGSGFEAFLTSSMEYLFRKRLEGNGLEYFSAVAGFLMFLPRKVKEKVRPRLIQYKAKIAEVLEEKTGEIDLVKSAKRKKEKANTIAMQLADMLVDEITNELDNLGLYFRFKEVPVGGETEDVENIYAD